METMNKVFKVIGIVFNIIIYVVMFYIVAIKNEPTNSDLALLMVICLIIITDKLNDIYDFWKKIYFKEGDDEEDL